MSSSSSMDSGEESGSPARTRVRFNAAYRTREQRQNSRDLQSHRSARGPTPPANRSSVAPTRAVPPVPQPRAMSPRDQPAPQPRPEPPRPETTSRGTSPTPPVGVERVETRDRSRSPSGRWRFSTPGLLPIPMPTTPPRIPLFQMEDLDDLPPVLPILPPPSPPPPSTQ